MAVILAVTALVGCGGASADDLVGTWYRVDDHAFVLTIDEAAGDAYEVRFENTANGESQVIAGIPRSGGTLQAAMMVPQEPVGALAAGVPDVVPITLALADGVLVVTMDGRGDAPAVELWRYERDGT